MDGVKGDEKLVGVREDDQRGGWMEADDWLYVFLIEQWHGEKRSDRAETTGMNECVI